MHIMPAHRSDLIFGAASPVLQAISASLFFTDSKDFVDMPLKSSPEEVLENFQESIGRHQTPLNHTVIARFLDENFRPAGSDLVAWIPPDLPPEPPFLSALKARGSNFDLDSKLEKWVLHLHKLWGVLGRQITPSVFEMPERHTLLPRRNPLVVPGGRFREGYYWDSLWIVRGLIVSGAVDTASGVVENMLDDVNNYGFVPNGGRAYYLNRSQPPLLSEMVMALARAADDGEVSEDVKRTVLRAAGVLQKEHSWWMDPTNGRSVLLERSGMRVRLNRYNANTGSARPESFREDEAVVQGLMGEERRWVLQQLSATAESGWDFSARWFGRSPERVEDKTSEVAEEEKLTCFCSTGGEIPQRGSREEKLRRLQTTLVVPVDLNVYLLRMERNIAALLDRDGQSAEAENFRAQATMRAEAMQAWMLSVESASWRDLVVLRREADSTLAITEFERVSGLWASASDFWPLWAGLCDGLGKEEGFRVVESLRKSGLVELGGLLTTTCEGSEEQWDGPNAWPPLQSVLVEALSSCGLPGAKELAEELVQRWLQSNFLGWEKTGFMFEKYNGLKPGTGGQGGEYTPQVGFGWTNGVVLEMLKSHPHLLQVGNLEKINTAQKIRASQFAP